MSENDEEVVKARRLRLAEESRRRYGDNPFDWERRKRELNLLEHPPVPTASQVRDEARKRRRQAGLPEREGSGDTGENPFEGKYGK